MTTQASGATKPQSFFALFVDFSPAVQKNLLLLFLGQLCASGSTLVSTVLSSIIASRLTGSETFAGLPSTINFFVSAFAAWWAGRVMAARGRRFGLTIGFVVGAIGAALAASMAIRGSFPGFLIGSAMVGFANGTVQQSRYAAGEMVAPASRGRVIGSLLFGSVLGAILVWFITPVVRHFALPGYEIEAGWFLGSCLLALAAIFIGLGLRPDPSSLAIATTTTAAASVARTWQELLRLPKIKLALVSMMVGQCVMVILMILMPLHAKHMGHNLTDITGIQTVHVIGMFGFAWLSGLLSDRIGRDKVVLLGALQLALSGIIAVFAIQLFQMGAALFLLGTGWNFCYVAGTTLLADELSGQERARTQGLADLCVWLSAAAGAMGGGVLVGKLGFAAAGWTGLILALLPVLAVMLWSPKNIQN